MNITLDRLLASRDARKAMQEKLLGMYSESTLVCLTVVMPGSVKRNDLSLTIARAATEALRHAFHAEMEHFMERDLETGFEAYALVKVEEMEAKRRVCDIEDIHPIGRLFDLDVISRKTGAPISRSDVGRKGRTCLLCHQEARYCMRNKTHSQQELLNEIRRLVAQYA